MTEDPIVEEARRAGQAYVDSFKGDWRALFDDLRRRGEQAVRSGQPLASPRPQVPHPPPPTAKKAG